MMEKWIESNDACELTAASHPIHDHAQVLKQNDTFAVFGRLGEISCAASSEQGLYHLGTRHLSQWELTVAGLYPMMLNSTMKQDNRRLVVQLTTPDLTLSPNHVLPHGTLHLFRSLTVHDSALYEQCRITNYSRKPVEFQLQYRFAADYKDVFEVRGAKRPRRGDDLTSHLRSSQFQCGTFAFQRNRAR